MTRVFQAAKGVKLQNDQFFLRRVESFGKGKYVEKNIETADFMTGCR